MAVKYLIIREAECEHCEGRGWVLGRRFETSPNGNVGAVSELCDRCVKGRIRTEVDLREAVEALGLYVEDPDWHSCMHRVKMEPQP